MKVYFVRHGESVHNAEMVYQPADSALSQKGIKQAEILANRFKLIPVDIIFSSPFERTRQTAEVIKKTVQKEVVYTELLQEIRRPLAIVGRTQEDPEVQIIFDIINNHSNDSNWHYGEEENFSDLKKRGEKFLQLLESRTEDYVLCVTHATVLRMIVCLMMNKNLTPEQFQQFWSFFLTKNTGITLCVREEGVWKLITWNDHAHLG